MEKEEQKWELEEEEDEITLEVRKSRSVENGAGNFIGYSKVTNGNSESTNGSNGYKLGVVQSEEKLDGVLENEEKFEGVIENEEKVDGVIENEENYDGVLENEENFDGVLSNEEIFDGIIENEEKLLGVVENEEKLDGVLEIEEKLDGILENVEKIDGILENEEKLDGVFQNEENFHGVLENEEKVDGVLENEEKVDGVFEKEEKIEGVIENEEKLDVVLEKGEEITNGQQQKYENLVFYDKDKGIWKCRICPWMYQNGRVGIEHFKNHKGLSHKLMNGKTLNFETKGVEFTSPPHSGEQRIEKFPKQDELNNTFEEIIAPSNIITNIYEKDLEDNILSNSNIHPPQTQFQELTNTRISNFSKEIKSSEITPINEDEIEETGYDVERVIQEQNSHDLYCPNCNSCITRRVILRKRKRGVRISKGEEDMKRNKVEEEDKFKSGSLPLSSDEIHGTDDAGVHTPLLDDYADREREPDVFRCLSCFSFFIPNGNEFKLFSIFGGKNEKIIVRDEQEQVQSRKKNWFASIFSGNKQETAVDQGDNSLADVGKSDVTLPLLRQEPPLKGKVIIGAVEDTTTENIDATSKHFEAYMGDPLKESSSSKEVEFNQEKDKSIKTPQHESLIFNAESGEDTFFYSQKDSTTEHFGTYKSVHLNESNPRKEVEANQEKDISLKEPYLSDAFNESNFDKEFQVNRETDISVKTPQNGTQVVPEKSAKNNISHSQQDGLKFLISSNEGFQIPNQEIQITRDESTIHFSTKQDSVHDDKDGKFDISFATPNENQRVEATLLTESIVENKNTNFHTNDDGQLFSTETSQHTITKTKFEVHTGESIKIDDNSFVKDNDTVITIDSQPTGLSQTGRDLIFPPDTEGALSSATQTRVAESERIEDRNVLKIEVIKSIVYGGLAESITSLSVVSSAAGGGAGTVNILALGMANLIGGLSIICHNLWELKSDRIEPSSNEVNPGTEPRDRYKELLGRRKNFILHAIVSILSYIIFGLLPPIIYGFSFRKTDDKEFKLLTVSGASLMCIIVLAVGRAYVRPPPKSYIKTIATFVILGFMVSGVSYAAGVWIEKILAKFGFFEKSSTVDLVMSQMSAPMYSRSASY